MRALFFFYIFFVLFFSPTLKAQQSSQVNVLTWWGYLDKPWVSTYIQEKCHVSLSFDEYYTNDEFWRRWASQKSNYDIIIFEDIFYQQMKDEIANKGDDVSKIANDYNKIVRQHFFKQHYEKNVLYFFQSVTGFLWNNELVDFKKVKDLNAIFESIGSYRAIILDDPQVVKALVEYNHPSKNFTQLFDEFIDKNIHISNDYSKEMESSDFIFSYTWSGDAIFDLLKSNKPYLFIMNPTFSYVSSDLIAQVSNTSASQCVMRALSSKEFLNRLQGDVFYFSPYVDIKSVPPGVYQEVYMRYLQELTQLRWIRTISNKDYERINEKWKLIKLKLQK